jgi:hypothetical protein
MQVRRHCWKLRPDNAREIIYTATAALNNTFSAEEARRAYNKLLEAQKNYTLSLDTSIALAKAPDKTY